LRHTLPLVAVALCALAHTAPAFAEAPAVEKIELARFTIIHTARAAGTAAALARTLEAERDELARRMGRDWQGTTTVFVGEGAQETLALAPPGVIPPVWAAGLALPAANALLLDSRILRGEEGKQILRHEMAHLALGRTGRGDWPRWFQEGFAMLVAGEWSLARYTAMYRATVSPERAIPLAALTRDWPSRLSEVEIAYAESFSFVSTFYENGGEPAFRELIGKVADGAAFDDAFLAVYKVSLETEEAAWRKTLSRRYSWVPVATAPATVWFGIVALFLAVGLRVRWRTRMKLAAMEAEDKAQEAALRIALAEQAQREVATTRPEAEQEPDKPVLH